MVKKHLTPEERVEISRLHKQRVPKTQIAKLLGRAMSTITREFQRNSIRHRFSGRREYCPIAAQRKCDQRRHQRRTKKMERPEIRAYVRQRIKEYWSPDEVAARMKVDFPNDPRLRISHQTIYQAIRKSDHPRPLQQCLRRYQVRKCRKTQRAELLRIENRPAEIDRRERVGDWEGDTIVGANHSGGVISLVERRTGYTILAKVERLQAEPVAKRIVRRLKRLPSSQRRSITFDNGKEFARHDYLRKSLKMATYFANPRSPWQRGTNENTNGLVRQFLRKGTDFRSLSHRELSRIQTLLNERPRKRLGYLTPQEALQNDASRATLS
jgi:transposase, IS30 family